MSTVEARPDDRNGRRESTRPGGEDPDFDIRRLIRRHIRESPPASDPGRIAAAVAEDIPEEHLRTVVAQWLPSQVANELFNLNAERCGNGAAGSAARWRRPF